MLRKTCALGVLALLMVNFIGCGADKNDSFRDGAKDKDKGYAGETRWSQAEPDEGVGPGEGGDKYDRIVENPFVDVASNPLSTFSVDVDTASYSKVRMYLTQYGQLPPPDAVRIGELINYFDYDYAPPADMHPFAVHVAAHTCPWTPAHRLVRIGIKGYEVDNDQRPSSNLVFLVDVSGSMSDSNKLPLLKQGLRMLAEQLGPNDQVAMVVYAGSAGLVLPATAGNQTSKILRAIDRLEAGGSTNGGEGIRLAYQLAQDNFIEGGVNRVILCSDGDFNVGTTSQAELVRLVENKAKQNIFLTVLGFGMGNHNDAMMEQISNHGNGNYAFVDSLNEARKVLVEQTNSTLMTIAKDVKIQVEFNPRQVQAFRLIGYENRVLAAEDFADDNKDAGDIGAGHAITALYEVIPVGVKSDAAVRQPVSLKYQRPGDLSAAAMEDEMVTVSLRYKRPEANESRLLVYPFADQQSTFDEADDDFRFAASVAVFGMILRGSEFCGDATYGSVLEIASSATGHDPHGYRREFLDLVRQSREMN